MTFNTGNPIGSTDARDLSDNAENFDKALGTLDATWVDRLGVTRDTFEGALSKLSFYRVGDFTTGYTLTNMRQTLEYSGHEYSWAGAFPKVVAAGATPATSGGIGAGAWVDRTDDALRDEVRETTFQTMKRSYAEAGFNLVDGSFQMGGSLSGWPDVLWDWATGVAYQWHLDEAKTIPSGSTPATSGGIGAGAWVDRTDVTLRSELSAAGGVGLISGFNFVCAEAYSGISDTEIIQAAINDALSKGIKYIVFNRDYVVDALTNRQEVVFVGTHKISGSGAYRLRIIDGTEKSNLDLNTFSAASLPNFSAKQSPVVVIVGDSLTTFEPNTIDSKHTLFSFLENKIELDNPDKTFSFYNRGIGGAVFYELNTAAVANWPDWYTNHATPWLDYVSSLNPDLVIVSMGMNDSDTLSSLVVKSVIDKIKAFASSPDLIMMTTPVPSTEPGGSYDATFGSETGQEGRDYAAGIVRSVSAKYGVPVIDINRVSNAVRDGFDVLSSSGNIVSASLTSGAYIHSEKCRNWSAIIGLDNAYAYTATPTLGFKVGQDDLDVVLIKADVSGNIKLQLFNADTTGAPYEEVILSSQPVPSVAHQLRIEVYNNSIQVYVVGSATDSIPRPTKIIKGGGLYIPKIGGFESSFITGFITSLSMFSVGEHDRVYPQLTNNELWGVGDGTANTKSPSGGNGVNHPTSIGAVKLYRDTFDKFDFGAPTNVTITTTSSGGYKTIDGVVREVWGRWTAGTLAAQIDTSIEWPVAVSGTLRFVASPGISSETLDATMRSAQTIVTHGIPKTTGIDMTVHCLTQTGSGRFVDWVLFVV